MSEFQKNIWAPWRMEYIRSLEGEDNGCFICNAVAHAEHDERNLVLWRGAHTIVLLNRFPYTSGHTLIAPRNHHAGLEDVDDATLLELMQFTRDAKRVLEQAVKAQGFNIGINQGRCAGAGLPGHLHVHVVPRWGGDVNFMPVFGDVKVIPQMLTDTRELFLSAAAELGLRPTDGKPASGVK